MTNTNHFISSYILQINFSLFKIQEYLKMNISSLLSDLQNTKIPPENIVRQICNKAKQIFIEEPNIIAIDAPVTVCGNIQGHFYQLLKLMKQAGSLPQTMYLFLGNYVNRGSHSTQTILYLLLLKIKYPDRIVLLRGNHESKALCRRYGFQIEVKWKYGNLNAWRYLTDLFNYFPIAAVIGNEIFCIHAGLSPSIKVLDQVKGIDRVRDVGTVGVLADLLWSDPDENTEYWAENNRRGCAYLFGEKIVNQFNHLNNLKLIARGHQLQMDGYKEWFTDKNLISIWSAPNFVSRCGNQGSYMKVDESLEYKCYRFGDSERNQWTSYRMKFKGIPYFV